MPTLKRLTENNSNIQKRQVMRAQQKLLLLPIALMVTVLIVSMLSVEYYLKQTVEKQFSEQLDRVASNALTSLSLVHQLDDPIGYQLTLSKIVRNYTEDSDLRLSVYTRNGDLIADSHLTLAQLNMMSDKPLPSEVHAAIETGKGSATEFCQLLAKKFVYSAKYDANLEIVTRAGLPAKAVKNVIYDLRRSFFIITLVAVISLVIFGTFTLRLIKQTELKARAKLEQKVYQRTKEITLMQTLSTMLNAASTYDDASHLLADIMPKLLPKLSGAIFIEDEMGESFELVRWGARWQDNIALISKTSWQNKPQQTDNTSFIQSCVDQHCNGQGANMYIELVDEKDAFGSIHFVSEESHISPPLRNVAEQLSMQLSYALANIKTKNNLRNQAIRDPLTNLYNRRFMLEAFEQSLNRAERHNLNLAVLMIDLDHFKQFNDKFGHKAGDIVLTSVAELFKSNLRLEDIACRYGGEEFCVICPDTGLTEAFVLAEKLRKAVCNLDIVGDQIKLGELTISIGVAIYPNHSRNEQGLLSEADKALYAAKANGRNLTVVAKGQHQANNASHT